MVCQQFQEGSLRESMERRIRTLSQELMLEASASPPWRREWISEMLRMKLTTTQMTETMTGVSVSERP